MLKKDRERINAIQVALDECPWPRLPTTDVARVGSMIADCREIANLACRALRACLYDGDEGTYPEAPQEEIDALVAEARRANKRWDY